MLKTILTFIIFAMLGRCTSPHDMLNLEKSNTDQEFEIVVQSEIIISLESNPTTGYSWQASNLDTNFLKLVEDSTLEAESKLLGAPTKQVFRFITLTPGKTELNLIYRREWEKNIAPLDTFKVFFRIIK